MIRRRGHERNLTLRRTGRVLRGLAGLVLALALSAGLGLLGLNGFLNTWLLVLINRQPERMQMGWTWAWTWDARHVEVGGYTLRVQGPLDQWWLEVDHATLTLALRPLQERRVHADDVHAHGVVLRYRRRADVPPTPERPSASAYIEGRSAPIPGLENPPLSRPEEIYPPPADPWLIALEGVEVDGIRDVWLGDYRFVGTAALSGEVIVMPGASLDLTGVAAEIVEGEIDREGIPVVSDLSLTLEGALEGVDPVIDAGAGMLRHLDGALRLSAQVDDLSNTDIFFHDAPWVDIEGGAGRLDALLEVDAGVLGRGSYARAALDDLTARVGTYVADGDGRVDITLDREARLRVVFDRFSVRGGGEPLVRGRGFRIDASTPTLRLDEPPSGFVAVATLPRSEVPTLTSFDRYLPTGTGLRIVSGSAWVAGWARVEEDGTSVTGTIDINMPGARLAYAGIPIRGDARISGRVVSGALDEGRYDVRGSSFALSGVSVGSQPPTWWARLVVREGKIASEEDIFLRTQSDFACSDSSPFLRIAAGNRDIASWVEELVRIRNLEGELRASVGETSLALDHLHIRAQAAEVHLHLAQVGRSVDALLFARLGPFGAATRLRGDRYDVQLVNAKRWFHARLVERGTAEPMTSPKGTVIAVDEQERDDRRGLRLFGKDLRKRGGRAAPE